MSKPDLYDRFCGIVVSTPALVVGIIIIALGLLQILLMQGK